MKGVTPEQVAFAVKKLLAAGEPITTRSVRAMTGGSLTTISNWLKLPGVREGTFEHSIAAVELAYYVKREKQRAEKLLEPQSEYPPSSYHASPRVDRVVDDELFALAERFRRLQGDFDELISDANRTLATARDKIQIYARKVEFMETERRRMLAENREMREVLQYLHRADDPDHRDDG
ncbi:hypothetical protein EI969_07445 [Pseudomonas sp. PB101]|uniref:DNA-binding protein n=1 Tax=Pseudomonas sp. PB101 TaxID=2495428 RepID=UPI001365A4DF|nr:DNA-binding protein [Pseudomonas sp. PB101]MVW85777.1 hypothetical protein [Pseudomonas sp. PB101]